MTHTRYSVSNSPSETEQYSDIVNVVIKIFFLSNSLNLELFPCPNNQNILPSCLREGFETSKPRASELQEPRTGTISSMYPKALRAQG
jgi:hypothetical protein